MEVNLLIKTFKVNVKPVIGRGNIKGIVTWIFEFADGTQFKIYCGTIRLKEFGESRRPILAYDPPVIGPKYTKVFFIDNLSIYKTLCEESIRIYCEETGESMSIPITEEVDIDSIPI